MKRFAFALLLVFPLSLVAQAPDQVKPAEPTIAELKSQLADSQQRVAELEQQVLELNVRVSLAEKAAFPQIENLRQQAQAKVQTSRDAAEMARVAKDAEKPKK